MVLWDLPLVAWYPVMIYPPMTGQTFSPEALWPVTTISQTAHDLLFKDQLNSQHTTSVYCNLAELELAGAEHWALNSSSVLLSLQFQWTMAELQWTKSQQKLHVWNTSAVIISTYTSYWIQAERSTPVTVQFRSYICNFNCSRVSAKTWQKQIIDQPKW